MLKSQFTEWQIMEAHYTPLRQQLAQESPELYASLERSWRIAEKEWLPAISGHKGCFNSFPHIRNLEQYADDVLRQLADFRPGRAALDFRPVEKYLLLAAILFHDIGRTEKGEQHAHISRRIINHDFSDLGIEGRTLAGILADICCYHDCSVTMEHDLDLHDRAIAPYGVIHAQQIAVLLKFLDNLDSAYTRVLPHYLHRDETNTIEGYRRHTTSIRVDLRNEMVVTSIGFERSRIDPKWEAESADEGTRNPPCNDAQATAIVVTETNESHGKWTKWENLDLKPNLADSPSNILTAALQAIKTITSFIKKPTADANELAELQKQLKIISSLIVTATTGNSAIKDMCSMLENSKEADLLNYLKDENHRIQQETRDLFKRSIESLALDEIRRLLPHYRKNNEAFGYVPFHCNETSVTGSYLPLPLLVPKKWETIVPYLLLRKLAFPHFEDKDGIKDLSRVLFLVLAGNTLSSDQLLQKDLRDPLANLGISVRAWLLEYEEHLFTCDGRETFEPALSQDFLKLVADAMWHLSAGMFGRTPCSYQTLAAKLREGNVDLVRTAVRRLRIVTRHRGDSTGQKSTHPICHTIMSSRDHWSWMPIDNCVNTNAPRDLNHPHCHDWVFECIEKLCNPVPKKL